MRLARYPNKPKRMGSDTVSSASLHTAAEGINHRKCGFLGNIFIQETKLQIQANFVRRENEHLQVYSPFIQSRGFNFVCIVSFVNIIAYNVCKLCIM